MYLKMKNIKRVARICGLVLLMILASVGMGITGAAPALPKNRERSADNKMQTELVEKRAGKTGSEGLNGSIK